jgi:transcriptional regulator with XRE-family HTH domain
MPSVSQDTLTGAELRKIRIKFGMTISEFASELGYDGKSNTVTVRFREFERGRRAIPLTLAKLAWLLDHNGLPEWPVALIANYREDERR